MTALVRRALPLAIAMLVVSAGSVAGHPLHTSLAELVYDPAAKEIRISLRVFTDDLTKASAAYARSRLAVSRPGRQSQVDEFPALAYARASFVITDRSGRQILLASCGAKPVGDLMWLCFHAPAPGGPAGFRITHKVLFDLYGDQINLVQASYSGKKISLIFTPGDGFKRLD